MCKVEDRAKWEKDRKYLRSKREKYRLKPRKKFLEALIDLSQSI